MERWCLAAICVAGMSVVPAPSWASPLDRARVDREAAWIVHVDMERLRESPVGCSVLTERTGFPGSMFRDLHSDLGLDPSTEINALTAYALHRESASDSNDSVVLISSTSAADGLPKFMQEAHPETFEFSREGDATLLSWTVEDSRWFLCVKTPDNPVERIVVLSRSRECIASALSVLGGGRASLARTTDPAESPSTLAWPYDQDPARGSIAFVAANRSMWGNRGTSSPAFRGATGIVLDLREQHDDSGDRWTQLSAKVRMDTDQAAEQMESVAKGALAWLALSAQKAESPESCCKALSSAAPVRVGSEVALDVKVNSQELATIMDTVRTVHSPNTIHGRTDGSSKTENEDRNGGVTKHAAPAKNSVSSTPSRK